MGPACPVPTRSLLKVIKREQGDEPVEVVRLNTDIDQLLNCLAPIVRELPVLGHKPRPEDLCLWGDSPVKC